MSADTDKRLARLEEALAASHKEQKDNAKRIETLEKRLDAMEREAKNAPAVLAIGRSGN